MSATAIRRSRLVSWTTSLAALRSESQFFRFVTSVNFGESPKMFVQ